MRAVRQDEAPQGNEGSITDVGEVERVKGIEPSS